MSTDSSKRPFTRPTSEQLVDLHVYIVPKDSWNEKFKSAYNEVINQTISCGFVRVWPELTILNLREAIFEQLGDDSSLPKDYVFLRSVGRCLTQVRSKQEATLKVKCFIPPRANAPEIFILDAKYGTQSVSTTTTPQSLRSSAFGSSRIDSGHLSSGDEIAGTNGLHDLNEGHVMPAIHPAQSNQEPSVSRTASGAKSGGKRDVYSNATNEDSGISDEAMVDGNEGDYPEQRSESMHLERTEATLPDAPTTRLQSREETSRQSSRHPSRQSSTHPSRQSRLDETLQSHLDPNDGHSMKEDESRSLHASRQSRHAETSLSHLDPYDDHEQSKNQDYQGESSRLSSRHASRQSSRHESRQSRHEGAPDQDPGYEPVVVPRLDFSSDAGPEDNGLGDSMDTVQDVDDIGNDADMNAEMEEIRRRQAEELRLSRMKSRELSHSRGPPSGLGSPAREDLRSQVTNIEAEGRISRDPSRNDNILGVEEEMDRCLTQQTQAADVEEMEGVEERDNGGSRVQEWGADVANDALQDLQLGDEQDKMEEEDTVRENQVDKEYERLQSELEEAKAKRLRLEQNREDLVKRAKGSQAATQEKRHKSVDGMLYAIDQSRSVWKKKYYEEKKRTLPLEEQVLKLKSQLDQQHRKMLSQLEGRGKKSVSGPPSKKNDHKIAILKTNHDMDEVQRKVENAQMRLASEIKLRNQAENELRNLRAEVMQRKIHVSLTRSQNQLPIISEPGTPTAGPKGGRVSNLGGRSTRQGGTPGRQTMRKYKSGTPR